MRSVEQMKGLEMRWYGAAPLMLGRRHELMGADGETYATLSWKGALCDKAFAECSRGRYILRWKGVLRRSVTVANADTNDQIGCLSLGLFDSGRISLSGREYTFRQTGWKSIWTISDEVGGRLCTLSFRSWSPSGGDVALGSDGRLNPDLILLIVVSWFAMRMIGWETMASQQFG